MLSIVSVLLFAVKLSLAAGEFSIRSKYLNHVSRARLTSPVTPCPTSDGTLISVLGPGEATVGEAVSFMCNVIKGKNLEFSWTKSGLLIQQDARISFANTRKSSMLSFESVTSSDSGNYTCVASDGITVARKHISIKINGEPPISFSRRGFRLRREM